MSVTSVVLGGIELCSDPYFVKAEALTQLESMVEVRALLADMAGRHPHLVGWVEIERAMVIPVHFLGNDVAVREAAYNDLVAALAPRYVRLDFTGTGGTVGWDVLATNAVVEPRYYEAAVSILAANPVPA